jgi:hypothetical protein
LISKILELLKINKNFYLSKINSLDTHKKREREKKKAISKVYFLNC